MEWVESEGRGDGYGLAEFRRKQWVISEDGTLRTPKGAVIVPRSADYYPEWSSNLIVWENGFVQVIDTEGKRWTNYFPNRRAAEVAHRRLAEELKLPPSPAGSNTEP